MVIPKFWHNVFEILQKGPSICNWIAFENNNTYHSSDTYSISLRQIN